MNIQNKILICGVFFGLLAAPLTVMAADFTFNVPVNVQNQNANIDRGEVQCNVLRAQHDSQNRSIGQGVQFFTLDNTGTFQGTLTVAIFANADEEPTEARSYVCELKLRDIDGNFAGQSGFDGSLGVTGNITQTTGH